MGEKSLLSPTGKWAVGGAIALALGVAALGASQISKRPTAVLTPSTPAPSASAPRTITALGRIEPAGEVIKVGGPSGERIEKLLVKEGQSVAAGQTIAILESYAERLADKEVAESRLQDGLAQLQSVKTYGDAQISETQTRRSQANAPKLKELAAQKAAIARLSTELKFAKNDLARFQELQRKGAVSSKDLEDKQLAYQTKVDELAQANAQLARIQQEWRTNTENVDAQTQSAKAALTRSQAEVQIKTARSNLKLAQARLERTIIRAPQAGQILKVLLKQGESLEPVTGASSEGGGGIVELGNTRQMDVVAEVYETDIRWVKVGQPATLTSPAFSGQLMGRVARIGLQIGKNDVINTDPAANTDTRVIEVRVRLLNSRPVAHLTNLQVEVAINPSG